MPTLRNAGAVVPRSVNARSKVSNGTDLLMGLDDRSAMARRYRDVLAAIVSDAGGIDRMSEVRKALCARLVGQVGVGAAGVARSDPAYRAAS